MKKVTVELGKRSYDIIIGDGILDKLHTYLKNYKKILIISNKTVGPLYKEKVIESIRNISPEVYTFEIEDGEEYKSINTVLPVYDFLVDHNFDRSSLIVSLGGGVVCDFSGYVASTFMRGIDFIQIPTTLLAQVDASIGGKVAVNHKKGKNLIGTFYQPKLVFIDINVLRTLDIREIKTGLAEIIKHGVILDREYFDFIKEHKDKIFALDSETMIKLVKRSCEIKAKIVSEDEEERGVRAWLNYGHTFGHAVESITGYKVFRHGEAVVFGMSFAAQLSHELGFCSKELIDEQQSLFDKFEMDAIVPKYEIEKVLEILKHDKKVKDGNLIFILPIEIGKVEIVKVSEESVKESYKKIEGKKIKGVIDIGTNTVRLFVAEIYKDKIINKYDKFMEITRLGEDVDRTRLLKEEAIDRNIAVLSKYREIAESYGVTELKAAATSASRDAKNGPDFLERAKNVAGVEIGIIAGEKEGTLAFEGVLTDEYDGDVVVIDIGGGSTEFILGNKNGIKFIKSLDVGSVRLRDKFFSEEKYDENLAEAKDWLYSLFDTISEIKKYDYTFVGVAGTVTTQVSVAEKMTSYRTSEIHKYKLSLNQIGKNLNMFKNMKLEERKEIIGLNPKRADVIVAGTILLMTILEYFGKEGMVVSENDILEGLMLGY